MAAIGAALAAAAALGGAAFAVLRRRHSRQSETATSPEWRCECGQPFRVAGLGRHRVYWLRGTRDAEPLMSDDCPRCGRALPAEPAAAAA